MGLRKLGHDVTCTNVSKPMFMAGRTHRCDIPQAHLTNGAFLRMSLKLPTETPRESPVADSLNLHSTSPRLPAH